MPHGPDRFSAPPDPSIRLFHELMPHRVREILLVSTPYDAWIMEKDSPVSEQIRHAYRGLDLGHPPRLTWVSADEALETLGRREFDLVVVISRLGSLDAAALGRAIKSRHPHLPVVLLSHRVLPSLETEDAGGAGLDGSYAWSGNPGILMALIQVEEDRRNVVPDTERAGIRVILFVEDSPAYRSSLLPILYQEVFLQTRKVVAESLNEDQRLMHARARPKILVADTFETAVERFEVFKPFILGVVSDVQFPRDGRSDPSAGVALLSRIKDERWDIPLLMTSADPANAARARDIPAAFIHKHSPALQAEVRAFVLGELGFGDFVFQHPDGAEIARASNLKAFERVLGEVPETVFAYHWSRNDFSRWLFARTEISVASRMRPVTSGDFSGDVGRMRDYLVANLRERRRWSLRGEIVTFDPAGFDPDFEIAKIGTGSLGGKARGLGFLADLLKRREHAAGPSPGVRLLVPQTVVLSSTVFEAFLAENGLTDIADRELSDTAILERFRKARFPGSARKALEALLARWKRPLAVRPSSLLEDAQFHASAALYATFLLANDGGDAARRLERLLDAVKRIYASTFFEAPRRFAGRVGHRLEEERMAVLVQQAVGSARGGLFYPLVSGIAQSINYYPFGEMKSGEGIAAMVAGLGHGLKSAENLFRFSPSRPAILPDRSTVEEILANSQRHLFALQLGARAAEGADVTTGIVRLPVDDASGDPGFHLVAGTYFPEENRIRDGAWPGGTAVVTFANLIRHGPHGFSRTLRDILRLGGEGMGCPVEIEFAADPRPGEIDVVDMALLRIRPMASREEHTVVEIDPAEAAAAVCRSDRALGNGIIEEVTDVVCVDPDRFDPARTKAIAGEIAALNAGLSGSGRRFLLIGPGRWGSADPWLGIPVRWRDISAAAAIVETGHPTLSAEPSHGSHFFHRLTALDLFYYTVLDPEDGFVDHARIARIPAVAEGPFVAHRKTTRPLLLKVDGRSHQGIILAG
jgi:DNA-binding NarL/FixJ family response regulator